MTEFSLAPLLLEKMNSHRDHTAIDVIGRESCSYSEILSIARSLGDFLEEDQSTVTAVYCDDSAVSFSAVVSCLLNERPWIAFSPSVPLERILAILEEIPVRELIFDAHFTEKNENFLSALRGAVRILTARVQKGTAEVMQDGPQRIPKRSAIKVPSNVCCLFMTSGSAGAPKCVPLTRGNVLTFLNSLRERFTVSPQSRLTLLHEMTSSASLQNLLLSFFSAAALCIPGSRSFLSTASFLKTSRADFVHIVPSAIRLSQKLGLLKENSLPSVKTTLIGGEILRPEIVSAWKKAAPNSAVFNSYGPTEATVNISFYECGNAAYGDFCPIGVPLTGHRAMLWKTREDEGKSFGTNGGVGELLVSGPQVFGGYLKQTEETKFIKIQEGGLETLWYKTGDAAYFDEELRSFVVVGRTDRELKINGHRVDPWEIEAAVMSLDRGVSAAAVKAEETAQGGVRIMCYVCYAEGGSDFSARSLLRRCRDLLPHYMIPSEIKILETMPLNKNGKIDYSRLGES